jgi:hypothetical protein
VVKLSLAALLMAAGVWNPSTWAAAAAPCLLALLPGPAAVKEERREGTGVRNSPLLSSPMGSKPAAGSAAQARMGAALDAAAASSAACCAVAVALRDSCGVAKVSVLLPPLDEEAEWKASEPRLAGLALLSLSLLASWKALQLLLKLDLWEASGVRNGSSTSFPCFCRGLEAGCCLARCPASLALRDGAGVM